MGRKFNVEWGFSGSVQGPLLLLVFINALESNTTGSVFKLADDTNIFRRVRNTLDNTRTQVELDKLVE